MCICASSKKPESGGKRPQTRSLRQEACLYFFREREGEREGDGWVRRYYHESSGTLPTTEDPGKRANW